MIIFGNLSRILRTMIVRFIVVAGQHNVREDFCDAAALQIQLFIFQKQQFCYIGAFIKVSATNCGDDQLFLVTNFQLQISLVIYFFNQLFNRVDQSIFYLFVVLRCSVQFGNGTLMISFVRNFQVYFFKRRLSGFCCVFLQITRQKSEEMQDVEHICMVFYFCWKECFEKLFANQIFLQQNFQLEIFRVVAPYFIFFLPFQHECVAIDQLSSIYQHVWTFFLGILCMKSMFG
eukprot:TRINITY_DN27615_c0_g1_i1.p2 TRINITY_DN27615_c0_g1~~TRINITY_DN27615_c0_g1_i1.p2  ORF type:complete len:232 (-),score=10.47 TRINITY_DN27615_c0_g1_i1:165-860(-)